MRVLLPLFLLIACSPPEEGPLTTPDEVLNVDPDVDTYVPDNFPAANPSQIVFLGDSITAGYGVPSGAAYLDQMVNNNDQVHPDFIDNDLTRLFPSAEVLDVSISGATTTSLIAEQLPMVEGAWGPSVSGETLVFITIGGNDMTNAVFSGTNLDDAAVDVLANVEEIAGWFLDDARFPDGAYVYITNVYEPTDGVGQAPECFYGIDLSGIQPQFDAFNASTRASAEEMGWSWVDLRGHFLGHGFNYDLDTLEVYDEADPTLWFQEDCIHPNIQGHHQLRRLFMAALADEPLLLE